MENNITVKNLIAFFPGALGYDTNATIKLLRRAFPDKSVRTLYPSDFNDGSSSSMSQCINPMCELLKTRYHKDQITLFPAHGPIIRHLEKEGYPFLLAAPKDEPEARGEYHMRYLAVDAHPDFISHMLTHWQHLLQQIENLIDSDDLLWMQYDETLDEALCRTFVPHPLKPFDMSMKGREEARTWARSVGLPLTELEEQSTGHFSLILTINQLRRTTPMLDHLNYMEKQS